jgi:NAD-dependent deacetylase
MSLDQVAAALRSARRVAVLTGAGISAESGLRTFRGGERDMDSLWKSFDPATLATPEAFESDPETVTRWYDWRRQGCLAAEPNAGHRALAEIERHVTRGAHSDGAAGRSEHRPQTGGTLAGNAAWFTLLTQNVDRLHQKAGSVNVVELHGSIVEWRCARCGGTTIPPPEPFDRFPPSSPCCRDVALRPNVVWFGEALPQRALEAAAAAASACDLFLSIGTSALVYPAAGYIQVAARRGAITVEINRDQTPISTMVDWSIRGRAGEVLPRLVDLAWGAEAE